MRFSTARYPAGTKATRNRKSVNPLPHRSAGYGKNAPQEGEDRGDDPRGDLFGRKRGKTLF